MFFLSSALAHAEQKPRLWEELGTTLKQVREVLDLSAEDPKLSEKSDIAAREIGILLQQREHFPKLMGYIANEGILESDAIVEDLKAIFEKTSGPSAKVESIALLKKIEFLQLALELGANNFAEAPKATTRGTVPVAPMGAGLEGVLESAPAPQAIARVTVLNTVNDIETAVVEHLGALEAYHASAKRTEKWVYWTHTFLAGAGLAYLASIGMNYIDWRALSPREIIVSIGTGWALNKTLYWIIWEKLGLVETMKQVFSFGLFGKLRESWERMIFKAPKLALPYVSAAAQDKPVNPEMHSTTYENAALEALMRVGSFGTEKQLLEIAVKSLENGQSARAMRILDHLTRHRGRTEESFVAARIKAAIHAKAALEWKVFRAQLLGATLRVVTIGLGLAAINAGAHYLIPTEVFTRWRSIAFAIVGVVGAAPILKYLWQHPDKDRMAKAVAWHKQELVQKFRELMEVDRNGEIVAKIAQYRTSATAQKFVTEAALEALEQSPRGGVSKTMMKMVADELAKSNGPSSRVRPMIESTFRQLRSCHANYQNIIGKANAALAGATP